MKKMRRWRCLCLSGLGLALAGLAGCQTWVPEAGLTLPSPRYLQHPPQYIPKSPDFPLSRELASMEAIAALRAPGAAPVGGPAPVPAPIAPPAPAPIAPPAPAPAPAPVPAPAP